MLCRADQVDVRKLGTQDSYKNMADGKKVIVLDVLNTFLKDKSVDTMDKWFIFSRIFRGILRSEEIQVKDSSLDRMNNVRMK